MTKRIRLIVLLAIGVIALTAAAIFKQQHNSTKAQEFHTKAADMLHQCDAQKKQPDYVAQLLESGHAAALARIGGLFGWVSEEGYFTALFSAMDEQATRDGKPEIARTLRAFAVGRGYVNVK